MPAAPTQQQGRTTWPTSSSIWRSGMVSFAFRHVEHQQARGVVASSGPLQALSAQIGCAPMRELWAHAGVAAVHAWLRFATGTAASPPTSTSAATSKVTPERCRRARKWRHKASFHQQAHQPTGHPCRSGPWLPPRRPFSASRHLRVVQTSLPRRGQPPRRQRQHRPPALLGAACPLALLTPPPRASGPRSILPYVECLLTTKDKRHPCLYPCVCHAC